MAAGCSSHSQQANAQGCGGCETMEEEFYWRHIKTLRFWALLAGNFHHKLLVPKKFADNVKLTVLQSKMTLRGPSGASWDVALTTGADGLFLEHGWEEFVKAYSLEENNLLLFKYDRHSSFDVKIFDGECEKAAAYFVKKGDDVVQKRASSEISHENEDGGICNVAKKARVDVVTEPTPKKPQLYMLRCRTPKQTPTRQKPVHSAKKASLRSSKNPHGLSYAEPEKQPDQNGLAKKNAPSVYGIPHGAPLEKEVFLETNGRPRRSCSSRKASSVGQNPAVVTESCPPDAALGNVVLPKMGGEPRKVARPNKQTAIADQFPSEAGEINPFDATNRKDALRKTRGRTGKPHWSKKKKALTGECYASNRRPVTEQERDQALRMAQEMLADGSFLVTMLPSFCNKKSLFLEIPSIWAAKYLGSKNYSVVLRVGEKTWPTRFNFEECGFESGWKEFAVENHLEEFDVCLFELTCKDRDSVMLDVTIVRVVDEVDFEAN